MYNKRGYYDMEKLSSIQLALNSYIGQFVYPVGGQRRYKWVKNGELFQPSTIFTLLENMKICRFIQVIIYPFFLYNIYFKSNYIMYNNRIILRNLGMGKTIFLISFFYHCPLPQFPDAFVYIFPESRRDMSSKPINIRWVRTGSQSY